MKKLILLFIALSSILMSCKKSSYVANFDKLPQERVAEQIALVYEQLRSAENGWIASLPTFGGGGYGFYIKFEKDENLTMYADLTNESASKVGKSYYRVKQDMGTDLVFDTYNYISMLNDPDGNVLGGEPKIGFKSDVEFIYDRSTADSIIFKGKKFRQPFSLVRATAAQRAKFEKGDYKVAIDKFKNFFAVNENPYLELGSGNTIQKIAVTPNMTNDLFSGKRVDLTGVSADGKDVISSAEKYSFSLEGITILNGGLVFEGVTFVRIIWKDANTLAAYDQTGKEYIIKNSPVPLTPLYRLWGSKYGGMLSEYKTIYPGTSAAGTTLLNSFHNNVTSRPILGYNFDYGRINFRWNVVNKRLFFDGHLSQSAGVNTWATTITYNYTVDDNGVYKFTLNSSASGGYAAKIMVAMDEFLLDNSVVFDYYIDSGVLYGKMSSVEDPSIAMTFVLQ